MPCVMKTRERFKRLVRSQRGQGATELMLVTSVIVVAVVASAYAYVPVFKVAVFNLSEQVQMMLANGTVGDVGHSRNGSVGGDLGGEHGTDGAIGVPDGEL